MRPITVPPEVATDRMIINLITQWKNCHARHRICRKRIAWTQKNAAVLEKKRRREQWILVARILEIERAVIRHLAKKTHDRDIWSSKSKESRLRILQRRYYKSRKNARYLTGPVRKRALASREETVTKIRQIERQWMLAVFQAVFPNIGPPGPLPLHATDLVPRKLKSAQRHIAQEVA